MKRFRLKETPLYQISTVIERNTKKFYNVENNYMYVALMLVYYYFYGIYYCDFKMKMLLNKAAFSLILKRTFKLRSTFNLEDITIIHS